MFSSNRGYDSIPESKVGAKSDAQQKASKRKFLFGLIAALGLVSLVGALASSSHKRTDDIAADDIAEVSRAMVSADAAPCVVYANPGGALYRGKRVLTTAVSTNMNIEFKLLLKAYSPVWVNIFHVGYNNFVRSPSVWVTPGYRKQLHFTFNGGQPNFNQQAWADLDFPQNTEVSVRIEVRPGNAKIFFNNVLKRTLPLGPEDLRVQPGGVPVFASAPWAGQAAASLKDFSICQQPLPPPAGCDAYPNPSGALVRGKRAMITDVTQDMDIFFRVKLRAYSAYWLNIFHVGANNFVRSPSVWVHAGNIRKLHFTFNGGQPTFAQQAYANIDVALNVVYDVKMEVRGNVARIFFNGMLKSTLPLGPEDRKINNGVPVFASAPWAGPANAQLNALYICPKEAPKPVPFGCDAYPNPSGELIRARKIFDTDVTSAMDVEFKIRLRAYSQYWLSILHVGSNNFERSPSVWTRAGYGKQLHFAFNGGQTNFGGQAFADIDIELNKEYVIKIEMRPTEAKIYFDGVLKKSLPLKAEQRKIANNVPVFASVPWAWRANALVTDISICNIPTCKGSPNPSGASLVQRKWLFNTKTVSKMQISMKVKITAGSQGWANVFHLGRNPFMRGPGIWTVPNNGKVLHIAFNGGTTNNFATQQYVNVPIDFGIEYEIVFRLDGNKVQILFNGEQKAAINLNPVNRFYLDPVPVFAGNPWGPAAQGVVKDVKVCLFN